MNTPYTPGFVSTHDSDRLIAAAPDLLAALIAAEDRMAVVLENDTDEGKPEDAALVSAFKAARAAIAKATGEA